MEHSHHSSESAGDFESRFDQITSGAYTTLAVALGSRLGLFQLMSSMAKPFTSKELADAGNFKERLLREWLGGVVCSGIVEVVPGEEEDRYFLPHHRRSVLTGSVPILHEFPAMISSAHEQIIQCFSKDVPTELTPDCYPSLHEWRDRHMKAEYTEETTRHLWSLVPEILEKLERGARVLSVGCSSGHMEVTCAKLFPKSTFIGIDISSDAIALAIRNRLESGLDNVEFYVHDVYALPDDWIGSFDGVTCIDVLHDLPRPCEAATIYKTMLKPGGFLSVLDIPGHKAIADNIGNSQAISLYIGSLYYCLPQSLAAGGVGCGAMWGRENVLECLKQAGFKNVLEPQGQLSHRGGLAVYVTWNNK